MGALYIAWTFTDLGVRSGASGRSSEVVRRVAFSGGQEGKTDLALDAFGVGALRYAGVAQGLTKSFWYGTDIAVNAYQGYTGVTGGYQSYQQGSYGLAALQGIGGLLGIAGAGFGARGLGRAMALDPTMNPLNYSYRVTAPRFAAMGFPLPGVRATYRSSALLSGELTVGRYGSFRNRPRGDNLTPHHGPSSKYLEEVLGIPRDQGPSILLEHMYPQNVGRHSRTRTFTNKGKNPALMTETFRDALARDVSDVRRILIEDGVYGTHARWTSPRFVGAGNGEYPIP